jgi:Domain of unknown function (DUF4383)
MAKTLAMIFGIVFVLVGVLGFATDTDLLGLFHTDAVHDAIHLLIGIILIGVAAANGNSAGALKVFGIIYLLLAIIGFIQVGTSGTGSLLGLTEVNASDNYLHLVLAIVLWVAGKASSAGSSPSSMQTM